MSYRVQLEVPAKDASPEVVEAMKSVATALGVEAVNVILSETAPADSYNITVHTSPDSDEKE